MVASDPEIQATFKCRESVWKRAKIASIERGITLGAVVEAALRREFEKVQPKAREKAEPAK